MKVDYSGMAENLKSDLKKALEQNKETLKTCPFCGGEAIKSAFSWGNISDEFTIECTVCDARTTVLKSEEAIKAWNTRKPLERVIERLETEGKLADEERDRCARENPLQFDRAVGYSNGIFNAIEFIKGEMG